MKATVLFLSTGLMLGSISAFAQVSEAAPKVLTLDQALEVALSENASVKIADQEITRAGYALRGSYASLFPTVSGSGSYQRTIKKQVMYMDFDMSAFTGGSTGSTDDSAAESSAKSKSSSSSSGGIEVGRWNSYSAGISASMPLVNAQLWKSIQVSAQDVELAVEKSRSSKLQTVTQVKQAYFGVLLAKEAFNVYKDVYENAMENYKQTELRYNVQKASELEYQRAKSSLENAIPNVYDAESSVILGLWQLKAVMGVDLDENIDVAGSLKDYAGSMFREIYDNEDASLDANSTMRQLAIQAEELANAIKIQQYANLPTLALQYSYSMIASTNDFKFSTYKWSPYSFVGLSISVPIFAGGSRYNNIRKAKSQYDSMKLTQEDTERQLKIAIRQYLNQMQTAAKTYNSAESAVETARKAYTIAQKSYNLGSSTITELNSAQLSLTQAQLGLSQAAYNFLLAKANLEQVLGRDAEIN